MNGKPEKNRMITPKGEPLEDTGGGRFPGGGRVAGFFDRGSGGTGFAINIIIPVAVGITIIAFLIMNSVKIVDTWNRGVCVFEHEI
ncbi:MAG: hypothetical protein WA941_07905 [Nitrososphaeraceae archaeon]